LRVSFLAVDSTGQHETGEPRTETNPITLKYDYAYRDGGRRVTLRVAPRGTIRYTLDGSNPRNGGVCDDGEVIVPDGRDVLLAIAEAQGIWSDPLRVDVPVAARGGAEFQPDPHRPAQWSRRLASADRGRAFRILECLKRHRATIAGADITVSLQGRPDDYITMTFGPGIMRTSENLEARTSELVSELAGDAAVADVSLIIRNTAFASGTALVEAAKELNETLKP
jgi:hypothetical protein